MTGLVLAGPPAIRVRGGRVRHLPGPVASPGESLTACGQIAYRLSGLWPSHLEPGEPITCKVCVKIANRATLGRPWTLDATADGVTRLVTKRCCDGCGRPLGDASIAELEACIAGVPMVSVVAECGCQVTKHPAAARGRRIVDSVVSNQTSEGHQP